MESYIASKKLKNHIMVIAKKGIDLSIIMTDIIVKETDVGNEVICFEDDGRIDVNRQTACEGVNKSAVADIIVDMYNQRKNAGSDKHQNIVLIIEGTAEYLKQPKIQPVIHNGIKYGICLVVVTNTPADVPTHYVINSKKVMYGLS